MIYSSGHHFYEFYQLLTNIYKLFFFSTRFFFSLRHSSNSSCFSTAALSRAFGFETNYFTEINLVSCFTLYTNSSQSSFKSAIVLSNKSFFWFGYNMLSFKDSSFFFLSSFTDFFFLSARSSTYWRWDHLTLLIN